MPSLKLRGVKPLFHSPLTIFELDNAQALNSLLLAETAARRAGSPGLQRSNWQGWHSEDDFFARTEPGCLALRAQLLEAIKVCTEYASPGFDFDHYGIQAEGWMNVLGRGGLNTPHDHPAWVWSGCYYVSAPQGDGVKGGAIEFFDTRTNIRTLTVEGAECFASKFAMQPQAGMLLLFPSYLRHWVYPNDSDQDRVSVAFNARFMKTGRS